MFRDNTVFVVGAGASAEFGLPVGSQLLESIRRNCDFQLDQWGSYTGGSREIFGYYDKIYGRQNSGAISEFNLRLIKSWQIRDGIESAESIDEYIFRYSSDPVIAEVGKLQIAHAISRAEHDSLLMPRNAVELDTRKVDHTWIWTFAKALMNGVRYENVDEIGENITIICFNYDRCIEHYLEHALRRGFHDLTAEDARAIVSKINIVHPYGWLGDLKQFPYGSVRQFPEMAENIITWSESIRDPEIVTKMREAIREAEQIVFMGFGFAAQNMDLLNSQPEKTSYLEHQLDEPPSVYSTAFNMPKEVEGSLRAKITDLYMGQWSLSASQSVHFQYGAKCKEFFDIHRLNLVK